MPLHGTTTIGFVMVEQVRSLDWQSRGAAFIEKAPPRVLEESRSVLAAVLEL